MEQDEEEDDDEEAAAAMMPIRGPLPPQDGSWASCIRLLDPVEGATVECLELGEGEVIPSFLSCNNTHAALAGCLPRNNPLSSPLTPTVSRWFARQWTTKLPSRWPRWRSTTEMGSPSSRLALPRASPSTRGVTRAASCTCTGAWRTRF